MIHFSTIVILNYVSLNSTAKLQWQKTQGKMLPSKKPFGVDLTSLKSPVDEKKIIEIAMKFAFQIDSIILNLYRSLHRLALSVFTNDLKKYFLAPLQRQMRASHVLASIIYHSMARILWTGQ
jgi:hypothetical protein